MFIRTGGPKNVVRSGSYHIWLNTTVPSNYAGTGIINVINQKFNIKIHTKKVSYLLH